MDYTDEEWMREIEGVINKIGRMVVITSPWDDPKNLKRSWCLWELYCAFLNIFRKFNRAQEIGFNVPFYCKV